MPRKMYLLKQERIWGGVLRNDHWGESKRMRVQKNPRMVIQATEDWRQCCKGGGKVFEEKGSC